MVKRFIQWSVRGDYANSNAIGLTIRLAVWFYQRMSLPKAKLIYFERARIGCYCLWLKIIEVLH